MKKVLIISYHFPPMNVIASRRAEAYAKYLSTTGLDVTILTHRWEETYAGSDEWIWHSKCSEVLEDDNYNAKVIRVPRIKSRIHAIVEFLLSIPIIQTLLRYSFFALGDFEPELLYSYHNFKIFLWKHLSQNKFDCIIPIFSPHYHIKLAYEIKKEFDIPFFADYRDLWDNRLANQKISFSYKAQFVNYLKRRYHRKWIQSALGFSIVSEPWKKLLMQLTGCSKGIVITNGFEEDVFKSNYTPISSTQFIITYSGSIYSSNDFSVFIKSIILLLDSLPVTQKSKVLVRFFTHRPEAIKHLFTGIPEENLKLLGWIPKSELISKLKESSILFLPGFDTQPGTIPGKVFEYLGARRNIVVAPTDNNVLEWLLSETKAGISTSSPDLLSTFLKNKFHDWMSQGGPSYTGIESKIIQFSRLSQVKKLAEAISLSHKESF